MKERQFELLTIEDCKKSKKKIVIVATAVLVFGLIVGSGLVVAGLLRMSYEQEEISERIERSGKLQSEMGAEDEDLPDLKKQRDDEYAKNGASDKYYQLDQKIADIEVHIRDLKAQFFKNEDDSHYSDRGIAYQCAVPFIMSGAMVIFTSLMVAVVLYVFVKQRDFYIMQAQGFESMRHEANRKVMPAYSKKPEAEAIVAKKAKFDFGDSKKSKEDKKSDDDDDDFDENKHKKDEDYDDTY